MTPRRSVRAALWQAFATYRGLLLLGAFLGVVAVQLVRRTTGFARPDALVALLCVAMLVLLLGQDAAWRHGARLRFATRAMLTRMGEPSLYPPLWLRGAMVTAALVLIALAVARPKGSATEQTLASQGIDLMVALDVSNSMRVRDMGLRSRLEVAKELLAEFIDRSEGDRIGLVAFAGSAHVMCPFTLDHDTLNVFLGDLEYGSVARQGTSLAFAIQVAAERFEPEAEGGKVILILTDGEDQGSDAVEAAQAAAAAGIVIHTIGIGTPSGGVIPMGTDLWGNEVTKRYDGGVVTSRLDQATLQVISQATGGLSFLADSPARLDQILQQIAGMETRVMHTSKLEHRQEIFPFYLLPALLLLGVEPFVLLRRRRLA